MALNVRDQAILKATAERLDELLSACRKHGSVSCIDPALTAAVARKAKALKTALSSLQEAVDDPGHEPLHQEQSKKVPVTRRLYWNPLLYELARAIGYEGLHPDQMKRRRAELVRRFGAEQVDDALSELATIDSTNLWVLRPAVRKACWQLLGPPPEHPDFRASNERVEPAGEQATNTDPPPPRSEQSSMRR